MFPTGPVSIVLFALVGSETGWAPAAAPATDRSLWQAAPTRLVFEPLTPVGRSAPAPRTSGAWNGDEPADPAPATSRRSESRKPAWWPRMLGNDAESAPASATTARNRWRQFFRRRAERPRPSDGMLISRCRSLLHADHALAGVTIHVSARSGELILRGTVPTPDLRVRAEQVAAKTEGTRNVRNELTLSAPSGFRFRNSPIVLGTPVPIEAPVDQTGPVEDSGYADADADAAWRAAPRLSTPLSPAPRARRLALGAKQSIPGRDGAPTVVSYLVRRPTLPIARSNPPTPRAWRALTPFDTGRGSRWSAAPANEAPRAVVRAQKEFAVNPSPWGAPIVRPVARFAIPAPPRADPWRPHPALRANAAPEPALLGTPEGARADIETILTRDDRTRGLRYRFDGAELILTGVIRSPEDLHRLTDELNRLPGIDLVGWENLRYLE